MKTIIKTAQIALIAAAVITSTAATATVKISNDSVVRFYAGGLREIITDSPKTLAGAYSQGLVTAQSFNLSGSVVCKNRGKTVGDNLNKVAAYYLSHDDDLSKIDDESALNYTLVYRALDCHKA